MADFLLTFTCQIPFLLTGLSKLIMAKPDALYTGTYI